MLSFSALLAQGAAHAWLFIPSAILLGALHGLEPGHSKTMMAAFIVAIRGTVWQAVLLGLTATLSHTLVVWGIGLGGMYLWRGVAPQALEPYFQLASGVIVAAIAAWMFYRTWREQHAGAHVHPHAHDHSAHDHAGHVHDSGAHHHDADDDGHTDAHQRAHARDIRRRFANRDVTHWQIALFGLTGGLIPCPAAITVLLLCLQLKAFTLGAVLVLCFSIGLAITLVTVGVVAALGARQASRRLPGLNTFARRAPYLSSLLILAVGGYLGLLGWSGLSANPAAQNPGTAGRLSLPAGH
ncbi:nickel/cobalt efflux transporter [Bordetella hinzii]|uniref:nickel/cobalt efflux transporter n=1 Tax=Bordetella hinzii TaxID=103855 RepID=UPI0011525BFD|nr:nickel/cobalt efflux transporter [Bordetella hinzii]QDJ34181.1 nickel/cobalt efflux protein RcnA [Bordetella hinzii]